MRGRKPGQYKLSRATARIDEFWSHSWHTSAWMKYVTAWYLNCAAVAVACGMGALLGFILQRGSCLPPFLSQCDIGILQGCVFIFVLIFFSLFFLGRPRI